MEGREENREEVTRWGKLKKERGRKRCMEEKRNVLTSMMARVLLPFWTLEKSNTEDPWWGYDSVAEHLPCMH